MSFFKKGHKGYRKNYPRMSIEERFWSKVEMIPFHDCWEWVGCKVPAGYGQLRLGGKKEPNLFAHRVSYVIHNGEIGKGLFVLHKCDNPSCVNPRHLFLGTHQDNMNDMKAKGRQGKKFNRWHNRCQDT
jgi:hypothetical protein